MESKIRKLKHRVVNMRESDRDLFIFAVNTMNKVNEIIDYLNSQEQPEEKIEKVYVDPIKMDFTKEDISIPVEFKTREQVEEMFEDTPEEWEKRFIRTFGYWGEEIKFIKQLLKEREREVRKQERMIRLHKRVGKKIDNLEEPYKSFAKAGAGII